MFATESFDKGELDLIHPPGNASTLVQRSRKKSKGPLLQPGTTETASQTLQI